jgi:biopolymer transport protein ExbB/TolQ
VYYEICSLKSKYRRIENFNDSNQTVNLKPRRSHVMEKQETLIEKVRYGKGFKRSTMFTIQYLTAFALLGCLSLTLSMENIIEHLFLMTIGNPLMIPIVMITVIGIVMSISTFIVTVKEARVVEKMVANQDEINLSATKLPVKDIFNGSLFVKHFRKFSTSEKQHWSDEVKANLEGYLEEMIFKGPKLLTFFETILPILGLLGTAMGLASATLSKSSNASMFVGVGNAIGTTVFALLGKLCISTLNRLVISERNSLLKTVLVIFRIAQKGGGENGRK